MYAQVCIRLYIGLVVGLLGQLRAANKDLRYMQGTKSYNLTYRYPYHLEVVGY